MSTDHESLPEIESFNLADLDVTGLDIRLELTSVIPQGIVGCVDVCGTHCWENCTVACGGNGYCNCNHYN
jgi:hypothetical protein